MTTVDNRATNAIKICINRIQKNKKSVNLDISKCISSFSHSTILKYGGVFQNYNYNFFIVNKITSPFWVEITHIPPYLLTAGAGFTHFVYIPQWARASGFHKKKVFDPFGKPYLKKRGIKYWFQSNK